MHNYLRAIGFADTFKSEYEINTFLENMFHTYDRRRAVREDEGKGAFVELSKSFGADMGIRMCGQLDGHGFSRLYYYPYLIGSGVTTSADLSIEKKVNGENYTVVCDEGRVGISLIYYLQNPAEYLDRSVKGVLNNEQSNTTLSALSLKGVILLPMEKNEESRKEDRDYYERHSSLVSAAKNGDQTAIETLTLDEMDTYAMITRRIMHEDVFAIVDTYFMPYGMECDQYQIMGTIIACKKVQNTMTDQYVWQMRLECNGMTFDICINERDLMGEPEVGRRFKGSIWLQGKINFDQGQLNV